MNLVATAPLVPNAPLKAFEPRLHLVLDADCLWCAASGKERAEAMRLFRSHPDLQLTLLTRLSAWDICAQLNACLELPPCHLIADAGETVLHLSGGGEWEPDEGFEAWRWMLDGPARSRSTPRSHAIALALQFLECKWRAPRPLFVCVGDPQLSPALGLADTALLPEGMADPLDLPADTLRFHTLSLAAVLEAVASRLCSRTLSRPQPLWERDIRVPVRSIPRDRVLSTPARPWERTARA